MRCGLLTSMTVLLVEAGLVVGQPPAPPAQTESVPATRRVSDTLPSPTPGTTRTVQASPTVFVQDTALASPTTFASGPVASEGVVLGTTYAPAVSQEAGLDGTDYRFYINGEYILWRYGGGLPPDLAGVIAATGFDPAALADTLPLNDYHNGVRITAGLWTDRDHTLGFEVGGFFLQNLHGLIHTSATVNPATTIGTIPSRLILQPVIGGLIDVPNSTGIVDTPLPGPDGTVDLDASDVLNSTFTGTSSSRLWGTEANVRTTKWYFGCLAFDGLVGFRNLNLDEHLSFHGDYVFMEPPAGGDADETPDNTEDGRTHTMHTDDTLSTHNHFYGAQVGASFASEWARITLDGSAKLAVGGTREEISLAGSTLLDPALIEQNAGGAVIARPQKILPGGLVTPAVPGGITTHFMRFSVAPELNTNLGYQLTDYLRGYVGYNLIFITDVARVGDQSFVNATKQLSNMTVQGLDFGLQFRY